MVQRADEIGHGLRCKGARSCGKGWKQKHLRACIDHSLGVRHDTWEKSYDGGYRRFAALVLQDGSDFKGAAQGIKLCAPQEAAGREEDVKE